MADGAVPGEVLKDVAQFISKGVDLEGEILKASTSVREESKLAYKQEWLHSRLLLLSITRYLQEFKVGVPGRTDAQISERLTLLTVFVQGATVTESLISEGQYVKASSALKQDYELLTRMREVKGGTARTGEVPNVKHAPEGSQRFYGQLNAVAHPSNLHLLQDLIRSFHKGEMHGVSPIPQFNKEVACSLYELHVWLTFEMTREMLLLMIDMYGKEHKEIDQASYWFFVVAKQLEAAGFAVS